LDTLLNIDGLVTLALQFQHSQVASVQIVKAGLFRGIHGKLLQSEWGPVLGHSQELYPDCVIGSDYEFVFSAAIAASFNNPVDRTDDSGEYFVKVSTNLTQNVAAGHQAVMLL
jgi:hypothetical protein